MGEREALDLGQVESALNLRRVPDETREEIFEGLLAMEDEAVSIMAGEQ